MNENKSNNKKIELHKFKLLKLCLLIALMIMVSLSFTGCAFAKDKKFKEGFYKTGSMNVAREMFSATLLNDGRVFVAGGSLDD